MTTGPEGFINPHSILNRVGRLLWLITQMTLFRLTPWFMGGWRCVLLRIFGAHIGYARCHRSVRVWAPWKLNIGKYVYVSENVNIYNPYGIKIGDRVVISQNSFLCTASHDYTVPGYPLIGAPIRIMDDCWIAADVFIGPGVTIGEGAVVGARAVVIKDVESWTVVAGNPARTIKKRELRICSRRKQ